tara:strand:- start:18089 stop:18460 length:372 start_codon:yes stop_codon:yes gene_type:complete
MKVETVKAVMQSLINYQREYVKERDKNFTDQNFETIISFDNKSMLNRLPFKFQNEENKNEVSEVDLHHIKQIDIIDNNIMFYGLHHERFNSYINIEELLKVENLNIFPDFFDKFTFKTQKKYK